MPYLFTVWRCNKMIVLYYVTWGVLSAGIMHMGGRVKGRRHWNLLTTNNYHNHNHTGTIIIQPTNSKITINQLYQHHFSKGLLAPQLPSINLSSTTAIRCHLRRRWFAWSQRPSLHFAAFLQKVTRGFLFKLQNLSESSPILYFYARRSLPS